MSERSFRRDHRRRVEAERRRRQLRVKRAATTAVAAGAFALAAPAVSSAATLTVGSNADTTGAGDCAVPTNTDCTLRQAISDAEGNSEDDTILFASALTGQTLTLSDNLYVTDNTNYSITIDGPGRDNFTVDGAHSYYVDIQSTGSGLTISGLKFENGSGEYAGMIYAERRTDFTLNDSTVTGSDSSGGHNSGCCPPFYLGASGGGITGAGRTSINGSYIYDNYSGGNGPWGGGGIDNVGRMSIANSTISGNYASESGGGVFSGGTKYPTSLNLSDSTISGNGAQVQGGGVGAFDLSNYYGSRRNTIENTTISNNQADAGGGVGFKYVNGSDNWTISHSTLGPNNTTTNSGSSSYSDEGGGLFLDSVTGNVTLVDSTISGNNAGDAGGGAYLTSYAQKYPGAVQFENSTIASNTADYAGGIALGSHIGGSPYAPSSLVHTAVGSTILADNTPNDVDRDSGGLSGGGLDLSHSLVETLGPDAQFTEVPPGSNIFGVDPQLGPLANNGGPTLTELPAPTSPVVDKGAAPGDLTTDQRGQPRTQGAGTDIGSVELPAGPVPPPNNNNGSAGETKVHGIKKKHKKRKHVLRTRHHKVKIHVSFSSSLPGVVGFKCSVDDGPSLPCTSPFKARVTSAPGKGRVHTVTIIAVDANGNQVGPPRVVRFRIIREG